MPRDSRLEAQERVHTRSYQNLEAARIEAQHRSNYNSEQTRSDLKTIFHARFGRAPYEWQLDASEALILRLDCTVIAGTGAGKTMPFIMPLLLDSEKIVLIISPLKVLQADQAERFEKMNISTAAVNGDTWSRSLEKDLTEHEYQAILTSPEICLEHPTFRKLLQGETFARNICAVVVDEAHCIEEWGKKLRKMYDSLSKLRSFFPPRTPFLATSATLPPAQLRDIHTKLGIDPESSFQLNLGNNRPNITPSVQYIDSPSDYKLLRRLAEGVTTPEEIIKTMVFVGTRLETQIICREVREFFAPELRKYVGYLHAQRSRRAKKKVMRKFRQGKIKILITTEAAGMGADIPDVEKVIQLGVPSSLSVWMQRAGRAGRSPDIQACAILMVEKTVFLKRRRKRRKGTGETEAAVDSDSGSDDEEHVNGEDVIESGSAMDEEGLEWVKKVEPELQKWIETKGCRRDTADTYFNNPRRKAPTGECCDNCTISLTDETMHSRPCTPSPASSRSSTAHSTPSKLTDPKGKRPARSTDGPKLRKLDHLKRAKIALKDWCLKKKHEHYSPSTMKASSLMPEWIVNGLASNRLIRTIDDMDRILDPPWVHARRHGEEVLGLLKRVDEEYMVAHEADKRARADTKKAQTAANRAEQKKKEQEEKERQRLVKLVERAHVTANLEVEQAQREADRAAQKRKREDEERERTAKKAKRAARPPLAGSSVFNAGTLTSGSSRTTAPSSVQTPPASGPSNWSNSACSSTPAYPTIQFEISTPVQFQTPQNSTPMPQVTSGIHPHPRPHPRPLPLHPSESSAAPTLIPSTVPTASHRPQPRRLHPDQFEDAENVQPCLRALQQLLDAAWPFQGGGGGV